MSRDPKLPPDEAWDAVEKAALSEEARRVAKLSDAALDRALEKKGVDAKALRERGAALAAKLMAAQAAKAAPVPAPTDAVPSPAPRASGPRASRWTVWLVAAAVGALGATLFAMNSATVVAWFRPEPIGPDTTDAALAVGPKERAARLRDEGVAACRVRQWTTCGLKLEEAKGLDPAGDRDPRVVQARKDIADAMRSNPEPELPEKLKP